MHRWSRCHVLTAFMFHALRFRNAAEPQETGHLPKTAERHRAPWMAGEQAPSGTCATGRP